MKDRIRGGGRGIAQGLGVLDAASMRRSGR